MRRAGRIFSLPLVLFALAILVVSPAQASRLVVPVEEPDGPAAQALAAAVADVENLLTQKVAAVGVERALPLTMSGLERSVVAGDIAHYSFLVRTGEGEYDCFRLHRVIREPRPCRPLRTAKNIFLQHGDAKDFVGMFLPGLYSPSTPDDFGIAVYLARHGVDVWGIDQAWTMVPEEETDFGFMADYGIGRAARDLGLGIAVARAVRLATGSGWGQMILSGYSSGVFETAALLNQETQLPATLQQVCGYVPVDIPLKANDSASQQYLVGDLALQEAALAAGQFQTFVPFRLVGQLARNLPDDPSPLIPGFTNLQTACYFSFAPGVAFPSSFHYWAGVLDETGFPNGPRLTAREMWLDFLESAIVWQPTLFFRDYDLFWVAPFDGLSSPFDDYLGLIRVPVLNVTPAGGFGDLTFYGISLLGSQDVEMLVPSLGPPVETDVGHIDIYTWAGSEDLFWRPLLQWIRTHSAGYGGLAMWGEDVEDDLASGLDAQPGAGDLAFGLERITPNPQRGPLVVSFTLPAAGPARLEVVDVAGRLVRSTDVGAMGPGRHTVQLGGTSDLRPGVYLVRLSRDGQASTQRATVLR